MTAASLGNVAIFHLAGFVIGLVALALVVLDVSLLAHSNWNIFSSRFFLKKEKARAYNFRLAYFLTVALAAATLGHYAHVLGTDPVFTTITSLITTFSLTVAIAYSYTLKRVLAGKEE